MTSTADGLFESPKKSMRTCTTLAATSENLMAHEWMLWMSSWRYSTFYAGPLRGKRSGHKQPE